MHIIQKRILKRLSEGTCLRYSDMKPANIESNQFTYHLKSLVRQKYVRKDANEYCLTTKGLEFCTSVNTEYFFVRAQPKIVTLIVCKNDKGEYLTYRRKRQPFIGMIGFPYGKIHMGESVKDAAERELREKTGITAQMKQKGIAYVTVLDKEGEIIAHLLFHVFMGSHPKGDVQDGDYGKVFWMNKKDLLASNIMPGVLSIMGMTEKKTENLQFEEFVFQHAE